MNINAGRLITELEELLSTVADAPFNSAPRPPLKADHLSSCLLATPLCDGKRKRKEKTFSGKQTIFHMSFFFFFLF